LKIRLLRRCAKIDWQSFAAVSKDRNTSSSDHTVPVLSTAYDVPKGLNLRDSSLVVYEAVSFDIIGEHTRAGYIPVAPHSPPPLKNVYCKHDDIKDYT